MNIDEFNNRLKRLANTIEQFAKEKAETAAKIDVIGGARKRMNDKGELPKGGTLNYSTKTMLIGSKSFLNAQGNPSESIFKRFIKEEKPDAVKMPNGAILYELKGGYKRLRELEGRQTKFISFNRTGQLWREYAIISRYDSDTGWKVVIGIPSSKTLEKKKLENSYKRAGQNILKWNDAEGKRIQENFKKDVIKYTRQILGL